MTSPTSQAVTPTDEKPHGQLKGSVSANCNPIVNLPTEDEWGNRSRESRSAEYAKLSDTKLAKKIRHLRRAIPRMTLQRNADALSWLLDIALAEATKRVRHTPESTNV